jgi:hypothetical protein
VASAIDIANMALTRIGQKRIVAFTDDTERARLCDLYYDQARKEVLVSHPWGVASKRVSLAVDGAAPAHGYNNRFTLPGDYLRVLSVESASGHTWEVEGNFIVTSEDAPLKLKYTFDLEDTTRFNPTMVNCIVLRLAAHLAEKVTTSTTKKATLIQEYDIELDDAKRIDGRQRSAQPIADTSWITARG